MPRNTSKPATQRFRLTLAYDGTAYAGWQVQPDRATIQSLLEERLALLVKHPCKVHGSGRTDSGVHAVGQVAHVDLATRMAPAALLRALNARLPPDIRVKAVQRVAATFHARRDATAKEYRYHLYNGDVMPPHERLYALHLYGPLDLAAMEAGAACFVGRHDFASFMSNPDRVLESTVRTISSFTIRRRGPRLTFVVRGNGFLYRQVRSMVGLLLRIGRGDEAPGLVAELLASHQPRTARVPSAPPQGLFLWRVWY